MMQYPSKPPSFEIIHDIVEACCNHLCDQGIATSFTRLSASDVTTTNFVVIPELTRMACCLSVVITSEMRTELVLTTPMHGHYLLDITGSESRGFCASVVEGWVTVAIAIAQRRRSLYWRDDDWQAIEAEEGAEVSYEASDGAF